MSLLKTKFFKKLFRNPGTIIGLVLFLLLVIVAFIAPFISGDPIVQDTGIRLTAPSSEHWFGTDSLGRDVYSRVIHGTSISLRLGFFVVILSILIGSIVGLAAGLMDGVIDDILMRITDVFLAFPSLILAMAISAALGRSLTNVMFAVAAVSWPIYARLMRAQVLTLKNQDFVAAARALGAGGMRVALRHVLPNSLTPLMIQASFDIGRAILTAAGLSFIGFGAQPPTPEWGAMVSDTRNFIGIAPWASSFPAIAILITVLAFNLLGDGLRDILDPRDYS